jgi:hypothetical protein
VYLLCRRLRGSREPPEPSISSRIRGLQRSIAKGGGTRLIYGGNAFLYHLTLAEYEQLQQELGVED